MPPHVRFTTADIAKEYPCEVKRILKHIGDITGLPAFNNAWIGDESVLSDFGLAAEQVQELGECLGFEVRGWSTIKEIAERLGEFEPNEPRD